MAESLLSRKYIDGVYIPVVLLIVGTFIVKRDFVPYASAVALALAALKIYNFRWFPRPNWPLAVLLARFPRADPFPRAQSPRRSSPTRTPSTILSSRRRLSSPTMWPCTATRLPPSLAPITSANPSSYRFKLPTERSILGLPIGQHISIGADLPDANGKIVPVLRSYTPISGDHQPGYVDLLIKSYPQGNISKHMAGLKVGHTIKVKGPKGAFVYTPNMVRRFGMVAGGTGITPMLQIIRAIVRGRSKGDTTQVDLIFANVTRQDILLKEDLDAVSSEDPGIRVYYVLDRPDEEWTGGVGFVTADMLKVGFSPCWMSSPAPLTPSPEMAPSACLRRQAPALRPAADGLWPEEGRRVARLREGTARQQACRPGLCFLTSYSYKHILPAPTSPSPLVSQLVGRAARTARAARRYPNILPQRLPPTTRT